MFDHGMPLILSTKNRTVLVVGAGSVGRSKAATFLEAGATVHLVDPQVHPDTLRHPHLVWHTESYRAEHYSGVSLAVAAVNEPINAIVVADAIARGVWVCDTARPERGNFILPATVRSGLLTISISTAGAAPALTRRIKEKLQAEFDESFTQWLQLLHEFRREIRVQVEDSTVRAAIFEALTEWGWLDEIRSQGIDTVRTMMMARCEELRIQMGCADEQARSERDSV